MQSFSRSRLLRTWALTLAVLLVGATAAMAAWTLDDALKQMDKAHKDVKGLTAEAETVLVTPQAESRGAGRVSVLSEGTMRVESAGVQGWTLLTTPEEIQIYKPADHLVEVYRTGEHPERLSQYATLGFVTTGRELEKDYLVTLIGEETLDDRKALLFELTPKDPKIRSKVSKIQLWVDQSNWMPAQQKIVPSEPGTDLTIRYRNVVRNDSLNKDLFKPDWPKGTEKVKN